MSDFLTHLKIVIWNSQCIKPKVNELEKFLKKYNIHIALISETWLTERINFGISGYECYRSDRPSDSNRSSHGGVAILINKSIPHCLLGPKHTICVENIFVEVETAATKIKIGAIYAPPSCKAVDFKQDFNKLLSSQSHIIIGGDFNSKNLAWNNSYNDRRGNSLNDLCSDYNLTISAPTSPTLIPCRGSPSIVDFFISKDCLLENTSVLNELSSDHSPVISSINANILPRPRKIRNYSKAKWNTFREVLDERLSEKDITNVKNNIEIDNLIEYFNESIQLALERSVPVGDTQTSRHPYSAEINELCRERNWNKRQFLSTGQQFYKKEINRLNRIIRAKTSELNINHWNYKLANLNTEDKSLYLLAKNLKKRKSQIPPLKTQNDEMAFSDKDKADAIASAFLDIHQTTINSPSSHTNKVKKAIETLKDSSPVENIPDLVNVELLKSVIRKLKVKKAPGPDTITNSTIKQFSEFTLKFLVQIYNICYRISYFPKAWKVGKIIPIPKPNKDLKNPKNYRPITLLSNVGKLFESLILLKISKFECQNDFLINQQFGFKSGHSTTHQVLRITEKISLEFNKDVSTGMVLLDVEKAFDTVWHEGLIFKMIEYGFPLEIILIILSFLTDRESFVSMNGSDSIRFEMPAGLPQGSTLSPHLYIIYINDVPTPNQCDVAIFADDTAITSTATAKNLKGLAEDLSAAVKQVSDYLKEWKINLNESKTETILFSHSRIMAKEKADFKVEINNIKFEWQSQATYLGVVLDSKLLYKSHIKNTIQKSQKAFGSLYPILKKHNSVPTKQKLLMYKIYIRPILTYACPVWINAAKCHTDKLQVVQNKYLRMALNAPYSTPIVKLHDISKIEEICSFIKKLNLKFYGGLDSVTNPLINNIGKYSVDFRVKHKLPTKGFA